MSVYVTDAHALIWYLFSPEKLGTNALAIFETMGEDDSLVVPAVVVAEIFLVVEKRRVKATVDELKTVLAALQQEGNCLFPSLTAQDVIDSTIIKQIPDIFDRLIVHETQKRSATLITKDEVITKASIVSTIW